MLFNSYEFLIFLPIVFILYWKVFNNNLKSQNALVLVASYFFYGWWDWRFLFLLFVSSFIDYFVGLQINKQIIPKKRKMWLAVSLVTNLGILAFFKYFNFFIDSFNNLTCFLGLNINQSSLQIILPVGISFYTFQVLSYSIDIYRKKLEPTKDLIAYLSFVSFFPQLVAGPVERAKNLLPQFFETRKFDLVKAKDGIRQILWGLFKKVVIADSCAIYVNDIFLNYNNYNTSTLLFGIILFAFQIYGDFSGYSDIAIGLARLFGFELKRNFAYPYFSRGIVEYWRRWHISLSTWFRDYVYIPLGGSHCSKAKQIRNIVITFTISGLWHGASWNYILWGFMNGLLFIPSILLKKKEETEIVAQNKKFPNLREILQMFTTFWAINFTVVFFRTATLSDALMFFKRLFTSKLFEIPQFIDITIIWIILLISVEWIQRHKEHALQIEKMHRALRWFIYYVLAIIVFYYFNVNSALSFVYFQF